MTILLGFVAVIVMGSFYRSIDEIAHLLGRCHWWQGVILGTITLTGTTLGLRYLAHFAPGTAFSIGLVVGLVVARFFASNARTFDTRMFSGLLRR